MKKSLTSNSKLELVPLLLSFPLWFVGWGGVILDKDLYSLSATVVTLVECCFFFFSLLPSWRVSKETFFYDPSQSNENHFHSSCEPIAICIFGRMRNAMQFPCVFLPLVAMLHRCNSKKVLESSAISEQWRTKALHHKALKDPMCRWRYPFFVFVYQKQVFFLLDFSKRSREWEGGIAGLGLRLVYTHAHAHYSVYTHTRSK